MHTSPSCSVCMHMLHVVCEGTQEQCVTAIGHIARIMRVKSDLLSRAGKKRRRIPR